MGNLLYYRYMNPAIVAPDAFDIIEVSAGGQLTTEQRRNLGSVAKMLQHAASNKMFLGDNAHLNPINEYLSASYQKFRSDERLGFFLLSRRPDKIIKLDLFPAGASSWRRVTFLHWRISSTWISTLTWSMSPNR